MTKAGAIRVIPGDPENSYLIHKLDGRQSIVGQRMPRTTGPFLTDGQIRFFGLSSMIIGLLLLALWQ